MSNQGVPGPLVLAGSGEYTPAMDRVDTYLLGRRRRRTVVLIATSCAEEGAHVMTKWEQMGVAHFRRHGVEAVPLRIADRADAANPLLAERIAEADFVWFSGGRAAYLAQTFHETAAWLALSQAHAAGAAIAGSSGGLGVLNPHLPDPDGPAEQPPTGLGLATPVRVMSHFDRLERRRPEALVRNLANLPAEQTLVGVEEDSALVWSDGAWRVIGHQRVHVFDRDGSRTTYEHGALIESLPPPARAIPG
jgi:cyanophycinase